jgi:hypothetical protein
MPMTTGTVSCTQPWFHSSPFAARKCPKSNPDDSSATSYWSAVFGLGDILFDRKLPVVP